MSGQQDVLLFITGEQAGFIRHLWVLTRCVSSTMITSMLSLPLRGRPATLGRVGHLFRCLGLEVLEDRVLPSIPDGWILAATFHTEFDNNASAPPSIVAVDPSTGAQRIISQGQYFQQPADLFEDLTTGMLYVADLGQVDSTGTSQTNPNYGFPVPYTGEVIAVDPNADPSSNQTRIAYNAPEYGQYLYGTLSVVFINNLIYVIDQGDGGGNLTTIPGNAVVHDLIQIDPTTAIQTRLLYGDTTADYLDYGGPHDPSNTNPPGWINVPVRMVADPNDSTYVYVADEQGRIGETHTSLPGAIWKVNINPNDPNQGQATVIISGDAVNGPFARPIHLAVDQDGNILVLGAASFTDDTPTIVSYDPTTYQLRAIVAQDPGGSLGVPTTLTVNQQATPYDPPGAIYVGTIDGRILKLSGGIGITQSSGGYLATIEKVIVYHAPGGHAAALPASPSSAAVRDNAAQFDNADSALKELLLSLVVVNIGAVALLALWPPPSEPASAGRPDTDSTRGSAFRNRAIGPLSTLDSLFADWESDRAPAAGSTQIM